LPFAFAVAVAVAFVVAVAFAVAFAVACPFVCHSAAQRRNLLLSLLLQLFCPDPERIEGPPYSLLSCIRTRIETHRRKSIKNAVLAATASAFGFYGGSAGL
jgi:hypothetical protein